MVQQLRGVRDPEREAQKEKREKALKVVSAKAKTDPAFAALLELLGVPTKSKE